MRAQGRTRPLLCAVLALGACADAGLALPAQGSADEVEARLQRAVQSCWLSGGYEPGFPAFLGSIPFVEKDAAGWRMEIGPPGGFFGGHGVNLAIDLRERDGAVEVVVSGRFARIEATKARVAADLARWASGDESC